MSLYETHAAPNPAGYKDVAPAQLELPPRGVTLVDVREPDEYTGPLGHIPGATLVPMAALLAQAVTWDKDAEYVLICRSGGRSASSAQALTRAGFTRVMNLVGGMMAWNAAGRPVER